MNQQISIYDHETGETIVREMTDIEQEEHDAQIAISTAKKAAAAEAAALAEAAKTAAQAKLTALGLTVDDLKALGL